MKHLYHWLFNYFAFSHTEMRGVFVLTLLGMVLLLSPFLYKPWLKKEYHHLPSDEKKLESMIMVLERQAEREATVDKAEHKLFSFNPNTADQATLELLGIPAAMAERIVRYRDKGGVFRKKSDLLKIYGFPKPLYSTVEQYIKLPEDNRSANKTLQPIKIQPFDVNVADSIQLAQLRGIGSVLSARIIKFRNALGGFHSLVQLREVYGLSDEGLEQLEKYAFIATTFIPKKIDLNTIDIRELSRHPYISYDLAKTIVSHRKTYGPFSSIEDLKEVYRMDDNIFVRLLPYVMI